MSSDTGAMDEATIHGQPDPGYKPGTGQAVVQPGGRITPEPTPAPETKLVEKGTQNQENELAPPQELERAAIHPQNQLSPQQAEAIRVPAPIAADPPNAAMPEVQGVIEMMKKKKKKKTSGLLAAAAASNRGTSPSVPPEVPPQQASTIERVPPEVPLQQASTTERVLRCHPKDFYGILGISKQTTERNKIREQFWYCATDVLTHSAKYSTEYSEKAFTLVLQAGRSLGCEDLFSELQQWGMDNGYVQRQDNGYVQRQDNGYVQRQDNGYVQRQDNGGSDEMAGIEKDDPPAYIITIYDHASSLILQLQQDPNSEGVLEQIRGLNENIKQQNKIHGDFENKWLINCQELAEFYDEIKSTLRLLKEKPKTKSIREIGKDLEQNYSGYIQRNSYPWVLNYDILGRDQEITPDPLVKTETTQSQPVNSATNPGLRVGLTRDGKAILGALPKQYQDWSGNYILRDCQFLIEDKEGSPNNPMILREANEVGIKEAKSYLELPNPNMINSSKKYSRADGDGFLGIKAITKVRDSESNRPPIVVWASFERGDEFLYRTNCVKIWGERKTTNMIESFYAGIGKQPPWPVTVEPAYKKMLRKEEMYMRGRAGSSRRETSRGRASERSRSSSRGTTTSHLSNERFDALEEMLTKLALKVENLEGPRGTRNKSEKRQTKKQTKRN